MKATSIIQKCVIICGMVALTFAFCSPGQEPGDYISGPEYASTGLIGNDDGKLIKDVSSQKAEVAGVYYLIDEPA